MLTNRVCVVSEIHVGRVIEDVEDEIRERKEEEGNGTEAEVGT